MDTELLTLYAVYLIIFIVLIFGTFYSEKFRNYFKFNLIALVVYAALIFIPSFNPENREGGSSLYFIVFGWFALLIHLVVLILVVLWKYFKKHKSA
jgi:hypothetical protein